MNYQKSISEQLNERSSPIWRWIAGFFVGLNLLLLTLAIFSLFKPDFWADSDPFSMFSVLSLAVVFLQFTPFARSIWLGEQAPHNGEIDEYERMVAQKVMTKAYRTTGIFMILTLFLITLLDDFGDIKLTAVSGGYLLMWFTFMFFSMPTVYAGFSFTGTFGEE